MTRLLPASVLAIAVAALLSGCFPGGTPTASPSGSAAPGESTSPTVEPSEPETAPTRDELEISPEGMGTLVFGQVPSSDPATQMLVLDPEWCTDVNTGVDAGIGPGDADAALWVPIPAYRDARFSDFGVTVFGGVLSRIDLDFAGPTIPTTEGVRVGDDRAAVEAAYPDADIVTGDYADIYVVTGEHGTLQLEVSTTDPYWEGFRPANVVVYIHATEEGILPFSVVGTENIAGGCPGMG